MCYRCLSQPSCRASARRRSQAETCIFTYYTLADASFHEYPYGRDDAFKATKDITNCAPCTTLCSATRQKIITTRASSTPSSTLHLFDFPNFYKEQIADIHLKNSRQHGS